MSKIIVVILMAFFSLAGNVQACTPTPWPFKGSYKKPEFRRYIDKASHEELFSYWLNEATKPEYGVLAYDLLNALRRTSESSLMKGFFETLQSITHLEKRPGKKIIINERAKDHDVFVREICELYSKVLTEAAKLEVEQKK